MSKKIATIILTVIFMVIFILVGVGSCGGIKYLINNRSKLSLSNATVYADEIGNGTGVTSITYISVPMNNISIWCDGYKYIPVTGSPVDNYDGYFFLIGSDLRFECIQRGKQFELRLSTYQYDDYMYGVVTDFYNGYLSEIPIAFMDFDTNTFKTGMLGVNQSAPYDSSYGKLVSAEIDVRSGSFGYDGYLNITLFFESGSILFELSPNRYLMYGDASINTTAYIYLSFKNAYYAYNGNVNVELDGSAYYERGFQAAYDKYYESRYELGKSVGYDDGLRDGALNANDYSFVSLIGAVIDVPVAAFLGMFDVEFLGVNMASFYKALLALSFVIVTFRVLLP